MLDNALLLQAIAGYDRIDDRALPGTPLPGNVPDYPALAKDARGVKGMKIGIMKENLHMGRSEEAVNDVLIHAAKAFEALGATVEECSVPMHEHGQPLWTVRSWDIQRR